MSIVVMMLLVAGLLISSVITPKEEDPVSIGAGIRLGQAMAAVYVAVIGTVLAVMGWLR